MVKSVIIGTGSYIPDFVQSNQEFSKSEFFDEAGIVFPQKTGEIIEKFSKITGIVERRYAAPNQNASTLGALAAQEAIQDSGVDAESIDQIIVSHNFGDVPLGFTQSQMVPSLANRIKQLLGIKNPACIGYDIIFGCPGWVQSLIQTHAYMQAGMAKKVLLVGTETLSRVVDIHDRDSMIFSDGAGACVVEAKLFDEDGPGVMSTAALSHSEEETYYIDYGKSYCTGSNNTGYIKMKGRKVYEYAMTHVPAAMKACMDNANIHITQVSKIFLHQANQKLDEGILKRLYQLYGINTPPDNIMPMSIQWLGNSSVATVPTLLDLVRKQKMPDHTLEKGDIVLFASVGAGMNINCVCYRI